MAAEAQAPATGAGGEGRREPSHGLRILSIWLVLSIAADLLMWFLLGPNMPPGKLSSAAQGQQFDINVMLMMSVPVLIGVVVYFLYAIIVWRHRAGDDEDGPPIHGNARIQAAWITITTVMVLFLFGFGTYELITPNGAGAGEGPAPIWNPAGARLTVAEQTSPWIPGKQTLVVQVIAQQWKFTYRYPQFGGFETADLVLPVGQWVQFDVTSLDVIHSFWAYQLGVKADANPGVDNVAYTKTQHPGDITVRCAELCGLWHGAMFDYGKIVGMSQFMAWASGVKAQFADVTKLLPPYGTTYDPTEIAKLSAVEVKLGLTGAGGGYYPPADPSQP